MTEIRSVRSSLSHLLDGKKIVLVVTASSAIYRSIDLARMLIRHGAEVRVVLTPSASRLISPELFCWATGSEVYIKPTGRVEYLELAEWCDLCVVAPCTLNTMSKIAHGITDNMAMLTVHAVIGSGKPVLLVPCMNLRLWSSPATRRALEQLRDYNNIHIYTYSEEDKLKFPDVELVAEKVIDILSPRDMKNTTVLITAGATREYIDPVKYISTPSSGLTGVYLAREAAARGAKVLLVHGYLSERARKLLNHENIESFSTKRTRDMYNKVSELLDKYRVDIAIFSAAPLDYELSSSYTTKIDSDSVDKIVLELTRAPKIIDLAYGKAKVIIGFKAEWNVDYDTLIRRAARRLVEKKLDLIVAHDVSRGLGFGTIRDSVIIMDRLGNSVSLSEVHKRELARILLTYALNLLQLSQQISK